MRPAQHLLSFPTKMAAKLCSKVAAKIPMPTRPVNTPPGLRGPQVSQAGALHAAGQPAMGSAVQRATGIAQAARALRTS